MQEERCLCAHVQPLACSVSAPSISRTARSWTEGMAARGPRRGTPCWSPASSYSWQKVSEALAVLLFILLMRRPTFCAIPVSGPPSSPLTRTLQAINRLANERQQQATSRLARTDTVVEAPSVAADVVSAPAAASPAFDAVLEVLQEVRCERDALQARVHDLERNSVANAVLEVLQEVRTERDQLQARVNYLEREVHIVCATQSSQSVRHSWLDGTEFASPPCSPLRQHSTCARGQPARSALTAPEKRAAACSELSPSKLQRGL